MKLIKPKIKDYPGRHIELKIDKPDLEFTEAKDIARGQYVFIFFSV
jgi:hypothetical protein